MLLMLAELISRSRIDTADADVMMRPPVWPPAVNPSLARLTRVSTLNGVVAALSSG